MNMILESTLTGRGLSALALLALVGCGSGSADVSPTGPGGSQGGGVRSIPLINPSFEEPDVRTVPNFVTEPLLYWCGSGVCPVIPGWRFVGTAGLSRMIDGQNNYAPGEVDGRQYIYSNAHTAGSYAHQDLPNVYEAETSYRLSLSVGSSRSRSFAQGGVTLYAGLNPDRRVAFLDLSTISAPTMGQMVEVTLTVTAEDVARAGVIGQTIGIRLGDAVGTVGMSLISTGFDNVSLSAIPSR